MIANDETQPRRADVFPPDEDDSSGGPGCLAWGVAGGFSILLALLVVLLAAFAGWNEGLSVARANATATRSQDIQVQCRMIPTDIAANRLNTVNNRFADLQQSGELPGCALDYVVAATEAYQTSLVTPTLPPTMTATTVPATPTTVTTDAPTEPTADAQEAQSANATGFDPAALLSEAEAQINEGDYKDAIDTLDAIKAIDPTFRPDRVDQLLFNALTTRARDLYLTRTEANLGEAISLTNRAENYGDLSNNDINFERLVGELYLDAQYYVDINYSEAIRLLERVRGYSPNYLQTNSVLVSQYRGYAEAFEAGGEYCRAVQQYEAALQVTPNNPSLMQARDAAQQQCSGAQTPGGANGSSTTPDPNATPQSGSGGSSATATPTFAPIGEQ